jgi:NAD(P)-dependent dehydrogenase (short-subunit alcohol dehydrogenase family)
MLLKDKVIVVTGGAGLLGRRFVKAVVDNGGIGIIADINPETGKRCEDELSAELNAKGKVAFFPLDITSKESIQTLIKDVKQKFGKIDGLVNNAYPRNKNYGRSFEDVTYEDFCENLSLHTGGYFLMMQQLGLYFKEQGSGSIINMSSIYGVIPPRFEVYEGVKFTMPVEYAAIKSAIVHLTRYAAKYFKKSGGQGKCHKSRGHIR